MKDCLKSHKDSCPSGRSSMPTRVIDVASPSKDPFLLVTDSEFHPWLALSHCWGRTVQFVTTTKNISDMKRAIPFQDMPLTFQDAVTVTRKLGYRYLWIDSLCIMQDSDTDWKSEAACMNRYYKNAVITISIDLAAGDHEGFLDYTRETEQYVEIPFMASPLKEPACARIRKSMKSNIHQEGSYLTTRGWALQEFVLSPRTLHYTPEHLVWECQKHKLTETDATPNNDISAFLNRHFLQPQSAQSNSLFVASVHEVLPHWYRLLEDYCQRTLTFENDRLYAISGLVQEIQQQTHMTYIVGLWKEDFLIGLLWSIDCRGRRPAKYRAPSFSWASLDISVDWGRNLYQAFELYGHPLNWTLDTAYRNARWLDCELEPLLKGDAYGPVRQGSLKLSGLMMQYKDWKGKFPPCFNVYWTKVRSHLYWIFPIRGVSSPEAVDQLICSFDEDFDEDDVDAQASTVSSPSFDSPNDPLEHGPVAVSDTSSSSDADGDTFDEENIIHDWDSALLREIELFQVARFESKAWGSGEKKSIVYALILRPTEGRHTYRRVGIAEIPDVSGLAEIDWEATEITIM